MLYMFLLDPFHKTEAAGAGRRETERKGLARGESHTAGNGRIFLFESLVTH
jgi:hypothetical protein